MEPTVIIFPYSCWETVSKNPLPVGKRKIKLIDDFLLVKTDEPIRNTSCFPIRPSGADNGNYLIFVDEKPVRAEFKIFGRMSWKLAVAPFL